MNFSFKNVLKVALVALVALQFWRPARNVSNDQTAHLSTVLPMPEDVKAIFRTACDDCHSNLTRYPWYAEIQPIGLWLASHVNDGKRHFNISAFAKRSPAIQNHKLEELAEMVKEKEMPLASYTWTHADARLTDAQRAIVTTWAASLMDTLKTRWPADSLVLKRR